MWTKITRLIKSKTANETSGRRGRTAAVKTTQNERSTQPQNSSAEVNGPRVHAPRATAATRALEGCKEYL